MIQHYSKVALRNLMKYKTQNLISTIGLAGTAMLQYLFLL